MLLQPNRHDLGDQQSFLPPGRAASFPDGGMPLPNSPYMIPRRRRGEPPNTSASRVRSGPGAPGTHGDSRPHGGDSRLGGRSSRVKRVRRVASWLVRRGFTRPKTLDSRCITGRPGIRGLVGDSRRTFLHINHQKSPTGPMSRSANPSPNN